MNKPLILMVDTKPYKFQELSKLLNEIGYSLALAKNTSEAQGLIELNQPALILLEIITQELDGIAFCHQLKKLELTKNIPVIFISALSETKDKLTAFEAGCVDYITKPFVPEEVIARLNVHIKLKQTMEALEKRAVTDELTGLFNRRFAYETLAKQIEFANRNKENFVVSYVDIDNLKKINDTYGHAEGDILINTVAGSFKRIIRGSDYLFRIGGDEFLFIFPQAKLKNSNNLIRRLRKELNNQEVHGIPIDFTYGFSEFHANENISPEELIKIADFNMYKIKMKKKSTA